MNGVQGAMSDTADELRPLDIVFDFARAVLHHRTRATALKRLGSWMSGFALGCGVVTSVAAAAQIRSVGVSNAWTRYGAWWLVCPLLAALTPIVVVLFFAAVEGVIYALYWVALIPLYVVPSLIVGEERADRWLANAGKLPLIGLVALVLWVAWTGGAKSAASHAQRAVGDSSPFAWCGTVWQGCEPTRGSRCSARCCTRRFPRSQTRLTSKAADALTEGRPTRVVPIYGPDNTVVREVILDD